MASFQMNWNGQLRQRDFKQCLQVFIASLKPVQAELRVEPIRKAHVPLSAWLPSFPSPHGAGCPRVLKGPCEWEARKWIWPGSAGKLARVMPYNKCHL